MLPGNTAVHVPTQEDFDALMEAYERIDWKWISGAAPTKQRDNWEKYKTATCIRFGSWFVFSTRTEFLSDRHKIIPLTEALEILKREFPEKFESDGRIRTGAPTPFVREYLNSNGEVDSSLQSHILSTVLTKKTMSISTIAKRILSKNYRTLVKAGFLNSELELTDEGKENLMAILFEQNIDELVKLAEEKLKEEKKK